MRTEGLGEMKLLLIEDDKEISEMLCNYLAAEGFDLVSAYDGQEGCERFRESRFDCVLLDLMIPKKSGLDVIKYIRQTSTAPIIIITAKDTDMDKTVGLGLGADDYITKPFSLTEVVARIRANIRRNTRYAQASAQEETKKLICGALMMDTEAYTVAKNGVLLDLTAREYEILKLLLKHPKKVYTKEQIYNQVWKDAYLGDENAVNVHISRLRAKVEDDPRKPVYIQTVWGIGYKLGEADG